MYCVDLLPLDTVKNLLLQIPSVTVLDDMTGPVVSIDGVTVAAVTRGVTEHQLNVVDLEKEFAGKKVALYQFSFYKASKKAGEIYQVFDPVTFETEPQMAEVDEPAMYMLRFAIVPK
jgi:L-fucose mutarotase/ribose pyranase (RbsD/FucU family)